MEKMETVDKEKVTKIAVKIIEELTIHEQISLLCHFASMFIDKIGDGKKFQIVKENIKTKEKFKMVFSNEKCDEEEDTEETK